MFDPCNRANTKGQPSGRYRPARVAAIESDRIFWYQDISN